MNEFLISEMLVSPDTITKTVVVACVLLFALPLMEKFKRLRSISPGLMVSVGILGTFWGTLLALHGFNASAGAGQVALDYSGMVKSIPEVIAGMKVAFITSLIGLFAAFVTKIIYALVFSNVGVPVEDLLQNIKDAINGKGDGSLLAQLKIINEKADKSLKLGVAANEKLEKVDGSVSAMSKQVNESLDKLNAETIQRLDAMGASLVQIDGQAGESLKLGVAANEKLERVDGSVSAMSKQVNESLDKLNAETIQRLDAMGASLVQIDGQAGESLKLGAEANEKLERVDGSVSAMSKQVNESLDKLNAQTGKRLAAMDKSLVKISGQADQSLALGAQANENLLKIATMNEQMGGALGELVAQTKISLVKLDQINEHMAGLADAIKISLKDSLDALTKEIKSTIAGQLVKQIKKTNEVLDKELRAMTKRIEDALIKEFGQTFKKFNEATLAIKKWQDEHKGQVESLTKAFDLSAKGIERIRSNCESIPESMRQLDAIIGELNKRVEAFADMREKAIDAFPAIEKRLNRIAGNLESAASGFDGLGETIKGLDAKIEEAKTELVKKMDELTKSYLNAINDVVLVITEKWGKQVVGITQHVTGILKEGDKER